MAFDSLRVIVHTYIEHAFLLLRYEIVLRCHMVGDHGVSERKKPMGVRCLRELDTDD